MKILFFLNIYYIFGLSYYFDGIMLIRSTSYVHIKQQKEMIRNMDHTTTGVEHDAQNNSKSNLESVSNQTLSNPKKDF